MKHRSFLRSKSDQAAAKLCAKWNCVNNSNNLHKPWNFFMNERCGMSKNRSVVHTISMKHRLSQLPEGVNE